MKKRRKKANLPAEHYEEAGRRGGLKTLKRRGPRFFAKIAAKRKTFGHGPGRPKGSTKS